MTSIKTKIVILVTHYAIGKANNGAKRECTFLNPYKHNQASPNRQAKLCFLIAINYNYYFQNFIKKIKKVYRQFH